MSDPARFDPETILRLGRETMENESARITAASSRLGSSFVGVVRLLAKTRGKAVVSGIGKSGHIGRKIVASLCSSGTPAVFLHPVEAVHGDLGLYQPGDPSILISKSGNTPEIVALLPLLKQMNSPIISLVGNIDSDLAREAHFVLDASISSEADPDGILPTASSTVTLALGDALAVATMHARGFTPADFARFHPSGQLGRNLTKSVRDICHRPETVACVSPDSRMRDVVIAMTERNLGAACVIRPDAPAHLLGIITDGDVRRALRKHDDIRGLTAQDIMTRTPVTISPEASLAEAVRLMEDRPMQLSELPVVDRKGLFQGLIRIHDIYQP